MRCYAARGFTLLEVVITLLLLGLFAGVLSTFVSSGFKAYFHGQELNESAAQARLALARMTRDVRALKPSQIQVAGSTYLSFIDSDGVTVSYFRSSSYLIRVKGSLGTILGEYPANANGLTFNYLQADAVTSTTTPADIRYVIINLKFDHSQVSTIAAIASSDEYFARVALRNED